VPEVDENVMRYVEGVLTKKPDIKLDELFQLAKKSHRSMAKLSKRQFNARYPLQVKRRRALAEKATDPLARKKTPVRKRTGSVPSIPSSGDKELVRKIFLQFATDITGAEERKDLVRVLAGVDGYVAEVLRALGKA
jgi:hypothetical protein